MIIGVAHGARGHTISLKQLTVASLFGVQLQPRQGHQQQQPPDDINKNYIVINNDRF